MKINLLYYITVMQVCFPNRYAYERVTAAYHGQTQCCFCKHGFNSQFHIFRDAVPLKASDIAKSVDLFFI
jgi:hypothetical protein